MYKQLCGNVSFLVVVGNRSQNMRTRFYKKNLIGLLYYDLLDDVCISLDLTLFYSVSFYFVSFSCTTQIHKLKFKSEYYLRIHIGNRVKNENTGNHTLISWTMLILGFFILKKQLASQDVFLVRSKLSITVYLFLLLYRSTSLQSLLFLKNIETLLCK